MEEFDIIKELRSEYFAEGLAEGRAEGVHGVLLRQGRKKFGEPDEATRLALLGITNLERLDRLSERILEVPSWQELLQTP